MTSLNPPSKEQEIVIREIRNNNVFVNAVAGSGKTTTTLHIANKYPTIKILLLTYNANLKMETRRKALEHSIQNLEVHSFHAFCVKYYDHKCTTDGKIINLLCDYDSIPKQPIDFNLIIIDESQDMTIIYYELICKLLRDMKESTKFCVIGDTRQSIYQFKDADSRFLTYADKLYHPTIQTPPTMQWTECFLTTSFRITKNMSKFINKCVFNKKIIRATKEGPKVKYIICESFDPKNIIKHIKNLLKTCNPEDIFILGPSTKASRETKKDQEKPTPIRSLCNKLTSMNIPIYVSNDSDEKIKDEIMEGKIVVTTFHQSKGLERDNVIVFGFDDGYIKHFKSRTTNPNECPNEIYVAITRAKKNLILIHHEQNEYFEFLNKEELHKIAEVIMTKPLKLKKPLKPPSQESKKDISFMGTTELIKFIPASAITSIFNKLKITKIREKSKIIRIKTITEQESLFEDVSEIVGTGIPAMYEHLMERRMNILNTVQDKYPTSNIKISINDELNNTLDNTNLSELMRASNYFCSFMSGYNYKLSQIKNYDFLSRTQAEECIERMKTLNLSDDAIFEGIIKHPHPVLLEHNKVLVGAIDCISKSQSQSTSDVWEFKCVKEIKDEHFIQLAIYCFLIHTTQPNPDQLKIPSNNPFNYYLYNILSDEMFQLHITPEQAKEVVDQLIITKFQSNNQKSDQEFFEICNGIKGKYSSIQLEPTKKPTQNQKPYIMVLDLETDGKHKIIEIAYNLYDLDMNLIHEKDILLNDNSNSVDFYKKIPLREIKENGIPPELAIDILIEDINQSQYIVCHNIGFDTQKIKMYFQKMGKQCSMPKTICTMESTKEFVNIPAKNGKPKKPKLEELYFKLFNTKMNSDKAHRGNYDVEITGLCLKKLIELGVITLQPV